MGSSISVNSRMLSDETLFDTGWRTGANKKVEDITTEMRNNLSYLISQGDDFQMFIGTDSEKVSSNGQKRRYSSIIGLLYPNNSRIFMKSRIEPNDLSVKARMKYEANSTNKLFTKMCHDLVDLLIDSGSGFELHHDINTNEQFKSSLAYDTVRSRYDNKKRSENPFLLDVKFKPEATFASKVGDRACRGKF